MSENIKAILFQFSGSHSNQPDASGEALKQEMKTLASAVAPQYLVCLWHISVIAAIERVVLPEFISPSFKALKASIVGTGMLLSVCTSFH